MEHSLWIRLAAELVGTALLVLIGTGAIAAMSLKKSKAQGAGWLNIALGFGVAIGLPVMMFGGISGAHLNPAITIALAVFGKFAWAEVLPYIVAQCLGAFLGSLLVYTMYYPYFQKEDNPDVILGVFATSDNANSKIDYFIGEFLSTAILALGIFGALTLEGKSDKGIGFIMIVVLVVGLLTSLAGPTGAGMNPARDFMPRLVHQLLPIRAKGDSHWSEAWIPVVAPILGAIVGYGVFTVFAQHML